MGKAGNGWRFSYSVSRGLRRETPVHASNMNLMSRGIGCEKVLLEASLTLLFCCITIKDRCINKMYNI